MSKKWSLVPLLLAVGGCAALETLAEALDSPVVSTSAMATLSEGAILAAPGEARVAPPFEQEGIRRLASAVCGVEMPCVEGATLRIMEVVPPGTHHPAHLDAPVVVVIQNHGLEPSPPVEAEACWVRSHSSINCLSGNRTIVSVPAIQPGETVEVRTNVRPLGEANDGTLVLVHFPPSLSPGINRPERALSTGVMLEENRIQFVRVEAGQVRARSRRLPVTGTLRNLSFSDSVPSFEVEFHGCFREPRPTLVVPELGPRESYSFSVVLNVGTGGHPMDHCYSRNASLRLVVDPHSNIRWANQRFGHERAVTVNYMIVGEM